MKYDFNTVIDRWGTDCEKWDNLGEVFGRDDLLPMWVADMDFPSPPQVVEALVRRAKHPVYGYTYRSDAFYEAFIGWLAQRHGWNVNRDWLSDAPGVIPGIVLCVEAFTEPGDQILIQTPVYRPFFQVVQRTGRQLVESPLVLDTGRYVMDFTDVRAKFAQGVKMMILCSPHNPVGRVWTENELRCLGELCLEYNVKIVVDEIWSDLVFRPHKHYSLAALSPQLAAQTITCMAPSKTFNIAGLNTAVIIIPNAQWKQQYDSAIRRAHLSSGNVFGITAFTAAYTNGAEWLDQLLQVLQQNRDLAVAELNDYFGTQVYPPEGTYLLWLDFRSICPDPELLMHALINYGKVGLSNGLAFGNNGRGFFRLNFGCPQTVLMDGLTRIKRTLEHLKNRT